MRESMSALGIIGLIFFLLYGVIPRYVAMADHEPSHCIGQMEWDGTSCVPKLQICHATGSENVPYIVFSPNRTADAGGHAGSEHQDGADIIPPFDFDGGHFDGQNWDAEGQVIFNNGCEVQGEEPPANASSTVDVVMEKSVDGVTHMVGDMVTYTLTVSNAGPDTATNVTVTDALPAGITFASATPVQVGTNPLTWNFAAIANGGTEAINITATVSSGTVGDITNTAEVHVQDQSDSNPGNNTDDAVIVVRPERPNRGRGTLQIEKIIVGDTNATFGDFSFLVDDVNGPFDFDDSFESDGVNMIPVPVGTYSITETPHPDFDTMYQNCTNVAVTEGSTTVCVITNTIKGTEPEPPACALGENLLQNGSFETPIVTANGGQWEVFSAVSGWIISLSGGLELWRNFMGGASDGSQNAELDGNASTMISQMVPTIPGGTYELRFDFSARPDADSASDNTAEARMGGNLLITATTDGTDIATTTWNTHSGTFVATGSTTDISITDIGTSNSVGSLVDNVVLCYIAAAPQTIEASAGRRGGGGGSRHRNNDDEGEVLGASTSRDGDVLGASTVIPIGAPDAGGGGTSPLVIQLPSILAIPTKRVLCEGR